MSEGKRIINNDTKEMFRSGNDANNIIDDSADSVESDKAKVKELQEQKDRDVEALRKEFKSIFGMELRDGPNYSQMIKHIEVPDLNIPSTSQLLQEGGVVYHSSVSDQATEEDGTK